MIKFIAGTLFFTALFVFVVFPLFPSLMQFLPHWGYWTVPLVSAVIMAGIIICQSK